MLLTNCLIIGVHCHDIYNFVSIGKWMSWDTDRGIYEFTILSFMVEDIDSQTVKLLVYRNYMLYILYNI